MPTCAMNANTISYLRKQSDKGEIGGGFFCSIHGWHSSGLNRSIVSYKQDYCEKINEKIIGVTEAMYGTPVVKNSGYKGVHVLLEDDSEIVLDDDNLPSALYPYIAKAIMSEDMFVLILQYKGLSRPIIERASAIYKKEHK